MNYGSQLKKSGSHTETQKIGIPTGMCRGLMIYLHVTDLEGDTPSVTPSICHSDGNGGEVVILAGTAQTSVSTQGLSIGLGLTDVANVSAKYMVPEGAYLKITHADAKPVTYHASAVRGY